MGTSKILFLDDAVAMGGIVDHLQAKIGCTVDTSKNVETVVGRMHEYSAVILDPMELVEPSHVGDLDPILMAARRHQVPLVILSTQSQDMLQDYFGRSFQCDTYFTKFELGGFYEHMAQLLKNHEPVVPAGC